MHPFVLLLIAAHLGSSMQCPQLSSVRGYIRSNEPSISCTVEIYNNTLLMVNGVLPGRWYGFYSWKCDDYCFGSQVSIFEGCDECFYCIHDQSFKQCKSFSFIFLLGSVCSIVFSVVLYYFYYLLKGLFEWQQVSIFLRYYYYKLKAQSQINKHKKRVSRINKILTFDNSKELELDYLKSEPINMEGCESMDEFAARAKARKDRIAVLEDLIRLNSQYGLKIADHQIILPENPTIKKRKFGVFCFFSYLLCCNPSLTEACDETLFISSRGTVCMDKMCATEEIKLIQANMNGKICFFSDTNWFNFEILNVEHKYLYKPLYLTSSFKPTYIQDDHCESTYLCPGNKESIKANWEKLEDKFNKTVTKNYEYKTPFDKLLMSDASSCYSCLYDDECTYVISALKPIGDLYKVYKFIRQSWEVTLRLTNINGTKRVTLTPEEPSIYKYPKVSLSSFVGTTHVPPQSVITKDGLHAYEVAISDLNFPVWGTIGDLQISLDQKTIIYAHHGMKFPNFGARAGT